MKLTNCGITVNATLPQDIARFKKAGYVEVVEEVKVEESKVEEIEKIEQPKAQRYSSKSK